MLLVNHFKLVLFIPLRLLHNTLTSCSLLPQTEQFDVYIILPCFVFTNFWFLLAVFFLHFKQDDNIVLYIVSNFYLSLEYSISSFKSSYSFGILFIKTNLSWLILESIKALEIKTSMPFNLDFDYNTILSCFFFFFLIIGLYFLIPTVIVLIFNPTSELSNNYRNTN